MRSKVVILIVAGIIVQQINCLTRTEIQLQYSPTLQRLKTLASTKYQETLREYNTLVAQLQDNQARSKNTVQTQINNIKTIIANAKKNVTLTTVINCLNAQSTAANRLTITPLNSCYTSTNTTAMTTARNKLSTISGVASNTVYWCGLLNPLTTQDEAFQRCLAEKIPDLNRQINIVENEYYELSNGTIHYNIKCLTDNAGAVLGQIGVISYEINVCFFTPL